MRNVTEGAAHCKMENKETWYVIYTRSRQEKTLSEKLSAAGFHTYVPLVKRSVQWSDRQKETDVPLFNSYVFIKGICDKHRIREYKGVVRFLDFGNGPAKVSQKEIDILKSIIRYGYDIREIEDLNNLKVGSKVMIIGGPLKGMVGELIANTEEDWFVISFESINSSIQVRVSSDKLKKI